MRIVVASLALVTLFGLANAHGNAEPPVPLSDSATSEASQVVDAFHSALAKGDRNAVEALLSDNVQIYEQGGAERSKTEYASHHLQSDMEFSAATRAEQTARSGLILGGLAYVITEGTVSGTFKGKAIDSVTLETMVLRREKEGWRIVHIHWSSKNSKK